MHRNQSQGIIAFVMYILISSLFVLSQTNTAAALPINTSEAETIVATSQTTGQSVTIFLPRTSIQQSELTVIANVQDPQSVNVAQYYMSARNIAPENLITVSFPANSWFMPLNEFEEIQAQIDLQTDPHIQAYAVTWTDPWSIQNCMSVTSAIAIGYNSTYCAMYSSPINYFESASSTPYLDFNIRPAMSLAGTSSANVYSLIDKSILGDQSFPNGDGHFLITSDIRSARKYDYQVTVDEWNRPDGINMTIATTNTPLSNTDNILFYYFDLWSVSNINTNTYLPGSFADHLTSYGGRLTGSAFGQMSILRWLEAGVSASYGTIREPYVILDKFPKVSSMFESYFSGATILEAYWKSVRRPGEGIFVGDPLTRPYGTIAEINNADELEIFTTSLEPGKQYVLYGSNSLSGPFSTVASNISTVNRTFNTIIHPNPVYDYYALNEAGIVYTPGGPVIDVNIQRPADNLIIDLTTNASESIPVLGTVSGSTLQSYRIEYQAVGSGSWILADGPINNPVDDGLLGYFDVSGLAVGSYLVRVRATASSGTEFSDQISVEAKLNNPLISRLSNSWDHATSFLKKDYISISGSTLALLEDNPPIPGDTFAQVGNDVYMYDLSSRMKTRITATNSWKSNLVASNNRIVWEENGYIQVYDVTLDQVVKSIFMNSAFTQPAHLDIDGDIIVYLRDNTGAAGQTIYYHDLITDATVQVPADNTSMNSFVRISGRKIIWHDRNTQNLRDIYFFDINTGSVQQISTSGKAFYPDISGDLIVWKERGTSPYWTIYLHDLSTGATQTIGSLSSDKGVPHISGDKIIWSDARNGGWDIYQYDVNADQETRITSFPGGPNGGFNYRSAINNDRIAWISPINDWIYDIYVYRADIDSDGMPDDWELYYFGNLNQTGANDYDNDGWTNLQEYLQGTDPTINDTTCQNAPAKVGGVDFSSLQNAYDYANDGNTIKTHDTSFTENIVIDDNKLVTIQGGYNCDYSAITGKTILNGSLSVTAGKLRISGGALRIEKNF